MYGPDHDAEWGQTEREHRAKVEELRRRERILFVAGWLVAVAGILAICLVAQGCGGMQTQWEWTYGEAGKLDYQAEQVITNPNYIRRVDLAVSGKHVRLNICGPAVLKRVCGRIGGSQCVIGHNIYVLGGPMPNGRDYLSQWGLGHELGHVLGYDVDHLGEGL